MLTGKRVVIVGGSAGIGLKIAELLFIAGAELVIVGRTLDKLLNVQKKLTSDIEVHQLDAADESAVIDFFNKVGHFDHLISTIKHPHVTGDFHKTKSSDLKAAFDAKFWGQYHLALHGSPFIKESGSIVLTSGIASRRYYPGLSGTAAINGAIESLVKSLAVELAPLRVNAVCPGFAERFKDDKKRLETVKELGARLPLEHLGSQDDMAKAYLFLLQNQYASGTILDLDGAELCS